MDMTTQDAYVEQYQTDVSKILRDIIRNKIETQYWAVHLTAYIEIEIKMGTLQDYSYAVRPQLADGTIAIHVEAWFDMNVPYKFEINSRMFNQQDPVAAYDRAMGVI